ncbi:hypothetical protein [Methanosphaerula palustris]|uniref:hypothetical protein n=1 Tax=Methanosphaerula palustris TaxID=475088 RepID=UPI00018486B2|nr:hypothetical protein [Methanosphaerula palustris]
MDDQRLDTSASTVTIRGSDLFDQIWRRVENIPLGHMTIQDKNTGMTGLKGTVTRLSDDVGEPNNQPTWTMSGCTKI